MKVKKGKLVTIVCKGGRDTHSGEMLTTTFTGMVESAEKEKIEMYLVGAFQITRLTKSES